MIVKHDTSKAVQSQLDSILDNHRKPSKEAETKTEKRDYGFPGDDILDTTGTTAAIGIIQTTCNNRGGGGYGGGYGGGRRW